MSFPSGVGTVSSLLPSSRSGAPHSSTFRCAVSAQITASYERTSKLIPSTFAAVPLNTRYTPPRAPNRAASSRVTRSVQGSSPYPCASPGLTVAIIRRTAWWAPA